jgi:hypothetical protein
MGCLLGFDVVVMLVLWKLVAVYWCFLKLDVIYVVIELEYWGGCFGRKIVAF